MTQPSQAPTSDRKSDATATQRQAPAQPKPPVFTDWAAI